MADIVKQPPIVIKCSDPSKNVESITCMAVESNTRNFPISMIWVYSNTEDLSKNKFMPSDQLQTTLSDALNYYPVLAGRVTEDVKGNITIHLTNEGVLYTEADCPNHALDYFIPRTHLDEDFNYEHINTSDLAVKVSTDLTGPCVSIQVTRLQCNSVILSITAFHCLFDAQSMSCFINTWASGKPPQSMPLFDKSFILYADEKQRQKISSLTRPKDCVFCRGISSISSSPFIEEQQQRIICKVYFFSANELKNIKDEASKDISESVGYISTYDALYAHMILVIAAATQTSLTENIKILQSLNGRPRFVSCYSPAVLSYFGSFAFWLFDKLQSDRQPTLSSLAQLIHEMHSRQSEHSLREYNAYLISGDGDISKNRADTDIINQDFYCSSWRKFNLLGPNFGNSGFPVYSGPTQLLYPRYFPMMDANATDESVNVLLGFKQRDYERMVQQNLLHKYR